MGAWVKGVHTGLMHMLGVAILLFVAASVLGQSTPAPDNIIEGIQQLKFDTKSLISPSNRRHKLLTQLNKAVADLKSGKKNLTKNKIKQARKDFRRAKRHLKRYRKFLRKDKRKGRIEPVFAQPLIIQVKALISQIKALLRGHGDNTPPVASAGADQTAMLGESVTLDGSASSDEDGDSLTYHWSVIDPNGDQVILTDAASVNPGFTASFYGDYRVTLVVNDGQEDSEPDTATVSTQNSRPLANAGPDQTRLVGESVTLDGSASSDVDGDALSYSWHLVSLPAGSTATLSGADRVNPGWEIDRPGTYIAELIVNDGLLDSEPDRVNITTENSPPVANAGQDQTVPVGALVTLDGSGSSDVDGDPLIYQWAFTKRPSGSTAALSDAATMQPQFSVDLPGVYILQLIVDDDEVISTPDTVMITTENSPPVADAGSDQSVPLGALVQLDAGASSDMDGDALSYQWAILSTPQGSEATLSDSSIVNPNFTTDKPGTYQLQVIVNDGQRDSEPDTLIVTTQNTRPVADAGPDRSVYLGDTLTLDGGNSADADGDPLLYRWDLLVVPEGSFAMLQNDTSVTPSLSIDQPGTYIVQLIVSDGELESEPAVVLISTENTRPQAQAGSDIEASVGEIVQVDGGGSQDADGDPLSYSWSLISQPEGSFTALEQADQVQARFVPDLAGTYIAQLIVRDEELASEPDSLLVTVQAFSTNHNPVISSTPIINATSGTDYHYIVSATDQDGDPVSYLLATGPGDMNIDADSGELTWMPNIPGNFHVVVKALDGKGGEAVQSFILAVTEDAIVLPPAPETVAPSLDPTASISLKNATAFLYEGQDPIQTGVTPGAIDESRAAVVRGKVLAAGKQPLPGVTVTIKDHPEFGQTISRADGAFDLAVNGGGTLTLHYSKPGHLPAQRQVQTPWQDFAYAEDVILIPARRQSYRDRPHP